jgi:hypothetical protein
LLGRLLLDYFVFVVMMLQCYVSIMFKPVI